MKKIFMMMALMLLMAFSSNVMALEEREVYYTNDNGVSLTKEEYDFVSKFYFDGYQKLMIKEDYDYIIDNKLMEGEIKTTIIEDYDEPYLRGDITHTTVSKQLRLSSSCPTSSCSMVLMLTWLKSPNVRSYDLIGAYSPTSGNLRFVNSVIYYDGDNAQYVEKRKESYGISATMKSPSSGEDIKIIMDFKATKGTLVHASYQHAKEPISLTNSRKYSFIGSGYGGVFRFEESVHDYYDAMSGIKTTI